MGEVEWLNIEALEPELVAQVFEPGATSIRSCCSFQTLTGSLQTGIKSEIREFSSKEFYDYLVNKVYPAIKIPVQYLCAEAEVVWDNGDEARPIFDNLVSKFTNASGSRFGDPATRWSQLRVLAELWYSMGTKRKTFPREVGTSR